MNADPLRPTVRPLFSKVAGELVVTVPECGIAVCLPLTADREKAALPVANATTAALTRFADTLASEPPCAVRSQGGPAASRERRS
jgi:hypothetical protein